MPNIDSLSLLFDELINSQNTSLNKMTNILEKYNGNDWKSHIKISDVYYHKEYILTNDDFEIVIITWNTSQQSKIHDHATNGCLMSVLSGELEETRFCKHTIQPFEINKLCVGKINYIDNNIGYHMIQNNTPNIAVTLHIYSPPNHCVKIFGM